MKLNSKLTWGLAWTGLAVGIAIPSADFLTGKLGTDKAAVITSTTDPVKPAAATPVKTASVTTTKTKTGVVITPKGGTAAPVLSAGTTPVNAADPVNKLLKTGKPLPDYISDGDSPAGPAKTDTQVASIDPVAPTPFPGRPWTLARPVQPKPIQPKAATPQPATDPVITGTLPPASDPVVVVDEEPTQQAAVEPDHPVPPAAIEDDTSNWRAQGLARYLDQNGLLADGSHSTASVTVRQPDNYDPDGFYLSDGPNDKSWRAAKRRARLERLLQDQADEEDDGGFSLF